MYRFLAHVLLGRWFMLFSSFFVMVGAHATFLFGSYSRAIKSSLGYNETQLTTLSFYKDFGINFGIFAGLLNDFVPSWVVLLLGAAMNFSGYFTIWLAVTDKIPKPEEWHMWVYIWVGANSHVYVGTAALVAGVKNFPGRRGIVFGMLKGYVGLSTAVVTEIYRAVFVDDAKSFILFLSLFPAVITLVFCFSIRPIKNERDGQEDDDDLRVFYHLVYISVSLALFLILINLLLRFDSLPREFHIGNLVFIFFLLLLPLYVVFREERLHWNLKKSQSVVHPHFESMEMNVERTQEKLSKLVALPSTSLLYAENREQKKLSYFGGIFETPPRGEDYTILQALTSIDMTIIFLATACGVGSTMTAIDNLGQVGESLGYPNHTVKYVVALTGTWNYFGRVFSGFLSETLLLKYGFPRPLIWSFVLLFSCFGLLIVAFPSSFSLCIASVILGFSFGAQVPLIYAMISEIFGLKYFSTLLNYGNLACPLGLYILNVKVTGMLYDAEARQQLVRGGVDTLAKELTCYGPQCFSLSFLVLATVAFFGAVNCLILVMRTWDFYRTTVYNRLNKGNTH